MEVRLCEHFLNYDLFYENPQSLRTWLFLALKADRKGFVHIHRRVLPRLLNISEEQCEEALLCLTQVSHRGEDRKILEIVRDSEFYVQPWDCCVEIDRYIPSEIRDMILSAGICAYCGTTENLSVDHKRPISRGGSSEPENLQCLCRSCNSRKGARIG